MQTVAEVQVAHGATHAEQTGVEVVNPELLLTYYPDKQLETQVLEVVFKIGVELL